MRAIDTIERRQDERELADLGERNRDPERRAQGKLEREHDPQRSHGRREQHSMLGRRELTSLLPKRVRTGALLRIAMVLDSATGESTARARPRLAHMRACGFADEFRRLTAGSEVAQPRPVARTALRKPRIVGLAGYDRHSRQALVSMSHWQRALAARVQVLLVNETLQERPHTLDIGRFCEWAAESQLELEERDVVACGSLDLAHLLVDLPASETDLFVIPGSRDLSAAIGTIPLHAIWARVVALRSKLLLGCGDVALRNVLVVSDGRSETPSVLRAAFDMAELFDVRLSHLDTRLMAPALLRQDGELRLLAANSNGDVAAFGYLSALHLIVDTVKRAPRKMRPDLLIIGVPSDDGGATASALCSTLLPCSVLLIPF